MKIWKYCEAREKIQDDLDLQEELFVTPGELLGYFNDAIDEAEAIVHSLYEDYFLTEDRITTAAGVVRYPLPSDIFANKLRLVSLVDGCCLEPLKRIRLKDRAKMGLCTTGDVIGFDIEHRSAVEGVTMRLFPDGLFGGQVIQRNYIRNANRLVDDESLIDIPEGMAFIFAYVKLQCYSKETHPLVEKAVAELDFQRKALAIVLSAMVPDGDNFIEPDLGFYTDHI
jgi:hypothetical protein